MKKSIPDFKSLEEEAKFWEEHSVMEFVGEEDVSDFLRLGGNKSVVVTLRMEPLVREQAKRIARESGKNYQTLMREWIYEGLKKALEEKYGQGEREPEPLIRLVKGLKRDVEEIKGAIHQRS
jgi:predicted DNA binding CopG/RHH family protein